jgi:hypothetical protein
MSKQVLIIFKCFNNKDIVRGIYNSTNSDYIQLSKFSNDDLQHLINESIKVNSARSYKSITYYYNVSDSWGEVTDVKHTLEGEHLSDGDIISLCDNLVNEVNKISSWRGRNGVKFKE